MLSSIALFQFHKGTIKPVNHEELADTFYKFQFHKGTIKPTSPEAGSNFHSDFNSIKVRLNLANLLLTLMVLLYFNSIKVRLNLSRETGTEQNNTFQFHKGTIKPLRLSVAAGDGD
mgnify:FL=1